MREFVAIYVIPALVAGLGCLVVNNFLESGEQLNCRVCMREFVAVVNN